MRIIYKMRKWFSGFRQHLLLILFILLPPSRWQDVLAMYPRSQKMRSKRSPLTKQPSADAQLEDVKTEDNNNNNKNNNNNNVNKQSSRDDETPHAPRIMKGRREREEGKERAKRSQSAHSLGQRNPLPSEDGSNRYLIDRLFD